MGNTPEPCDTCKRLYADALYKNDPSYDAECKLGLLKGKMDCTKYKYDTGLDDGGEYRSMYPSKRQRKTQYDRNGILIMP